MKRKIISLIIIAAFIFHTNAEVTVEPEESAEKFDPVI
jgi:hypothetical protein